MYTITLSADSNWLNSSDRVYPVIIDPTITHNADANFSGEMNRIADADSTSSTQLESSYPEATLDPYTVLLLHFNEANGSTSGIKDYASTTRVITANGNASTTSYVTQLGLGNSVAFDGTGDYLTLTSDSDDYTWGADFSVDMWVRFNDVSTYQVLTAHSDDTGANFFRIGWASIAGQWSVVLGTVSNQITDSLSINTWYHIAVIRTGSIVRFFRDGKQVGSDITDYTSINASTNGIDIGANWNEANTLNGNLDEFRIIKGRALTPEEIKAAASRRPNAIYTSPVLDASASAQWDTLNWTEGGVKTGDGETLYNSNSLVAQWNFNETSGTTADNAEGTAALDGTLNGFSYTASQDQATTTTGWTANNKKWGAGALMFDGTNDYVSVSDNTVFDFGTGPFTIESWINVSSAQTDNVLVSFYEDVSNFWYVCLRCNSAADDVRFYTKKAGTLDAVDATGLNFSNNWAHLTLVKEASGAGKLKIYLNGKLQSNNTTDNDLDNDLTFTGTFYIGSQDGTNKPFKGIMDSLRIYKGRALSAAEILSNYQAGNIEIQTRTGATSDPNDGSWEAWKPTTGETQLLSMDSDKSNWNAPEQIDGYTKLLLHMDGTDAATTFPNSATTTHTVTAVNQAQVDTAYSKFSGASALFDGTGDYLSVPDSGDWDFGGGDFTVDFWMRFNSLAKARLIGNYEAISGEGGWFITYYNASPQLEFYSRNAGADWSYGVSWTPSSATWYHIAVTRSGNNLYFFVNGAQVGATQDVTGKTVGNSASTLLIGDEDAYTSPLNGWMDELRISKGIARWTSNFTPPPRPYGSNVKAENETTIKAEGSGSTKLTLGAPQIDGNTVALWHFEETGTTTGTYLYDETANNNDATTTGTTVVDGILGKARKFNGTSDYLSAADSANWAFGTGDFTIDLWAKPEDIANKAAFRINTTNSGAGRKGWRFMNCAANSTSLCFYAGTADSSNDIAEYAWSVPGGAPPNNSWAYYVVTRAGGTLTIYYNGRSITSATGVTGNIPQNGQVNIGCENDNSGSPNCNSKAYGTIDEPRILKGRALSADEIAETYRMGANHHLTRQISSVDLSAQTKLPFWIAADRTGTYLEAMIGESDFANYELASSTLALSTTTVLYIKGDEIASSTSIKDSSFSGKTITANGNARTAGGGKIGNAMSFDGTGDYLSVADNTDFEFGSGDFSVDTWIKLNDVTNEQYFMGYWSNSTVADRQFGLRLATGGTLFGFGMASDGVGGFLINETYPWSPSVGRWYHIAVIRSGSTVKVFINGVQVGSTTVSGSMYSGSTQATRIGGDFVDSPRPLNGYLDELRIIKGAALTPDQIRQAYEYGLRTHPITIDFGATLQTSDLISSATDYNFSLTATTSGLSATTSGLYLGDKIIIKENLGGTEYAAQGTVNSINTSTGAITVPSWDSGSTFPSGNGYSPAATVFKWQREYFDLTGAATTTRDAITNLTLRPTSGASGRTVYLDDFRYNTNYLTASSSSTITSGNNRYLQYRTIFTSTDTFVSPFISALSTLYTSLANSFPSLIGISGGGFLSF